MSISEKPAETPLVRPPTATEASPSASQGPALSAQERAERELAKIDEQMDLIMAKPENRGALQNRPDQALQPPGGRSITPSVSAPVEASGINHLALNCVVPGLGSLVRGRYGLGLAQLGLAGAAVPMLFFHFWLALLMAAMAYVWSIASGIGFASQSASKSWR
jgi:hypothetical protein